MLQLAQAADDSIEAINVPTRTIEGRFTRHRTRPKPRARNVSCRSSPPTLPSLPYRRGRLRARTGSSTSCTSARVADAKSWRGKTPLMVAC